ncbi:TrkH family potassium uptake protein [Rubellicoccus peritrichatus]|uniref:TrkH family potassium uptake protein n=1 Tax=Rubellicoccus peritrichatus TaxID=3080537 RepID=A0AAQ3LGM0_9BACT|nr:TrkH family potassium uptake protein [Puniceicoccus sp. CR14]WOO41764.1 TrkH family potassium uptake protein [Puniceicoccus sp. CR14]
MNYRIIFKLLSVIMSTLAIAFLVSAEVGQIFFPSELETQIQEEWWLSIGIAGLLAVLFRVFGRNASPKIFRKEGLATIGLGWIVASLVGALPYVLILRDCTVGDAIFESTSGLTTTGASVFTNLESFPHSLMFWRCLSQWIGGLGVVVFFVAILSFLGAGAKILYSNEASAHSTDIESGRIQKGVIHIGILYLALSAICALVFRACGMDWFDAICHMFTTISTGGFSTYSGSIAAFQNPLIEWMIILFMIIGGTTFFYIIGIISKQRLKACSNTEVNIYFAMLIITTLVLTVILYWRMNLYDLDDAFRTSAFQVVSIMTTTGYMTADYDAWLPVTHTLLLGLMIIGGCSGSTSGGLKVVRVAIGVKVCLHQIEHAFRSRVVRPMMFNGRVIDVEDRNNVVNYLLLMGFIGVCSLPIISLAEVGLSFEGAIAAMFACLFNIGPGFHEVGPTLNFGFMAPFTKIFLSLLMIMGRLELYAVLVLFAPSLWKRFS